MHRGGGRGTGPARPGGHGSYDLWMCGRNSPEEVFGEPVNLGPVVNSKHADGGPALSFDGLTLLFNSNRPGGLGNYDLWMCRRNSRKESFDAPVNLGSTVNSPVWDGAPALSADGLTLLFSSTRPGGQGKCDLWMCRRILPDGQAAPGAAPAVSPSAAAASDDPPARPAPTGMRLSRVNRRRSEISC